MRAWTHSDSQRFWKTMPLRGYAPVLATVFLLFSTIGFGNDLLIGGRWSTLQLTVRVLLPALFAVAAFITTTRSPKFLPLAVVLFVLMVVPPWWLTPGAPAPPARSAGLDARLRLSVWGMATAAMASYGFFLMFIVGEGKRHARVHAEIALARSLHQVLAPPVGRRVGRFEFAGQSLPSDEVGGDLIDVVETGGRWLAYVADVSGHGVASGTVMAMFKSAMRSHLSANSDLHVLLPAVNDVLLDLKSPNMFITCACVAPREGDVMEVALAGHLPVLHYRGATGSVDELSVANLPLGMFERRTYDTLQVPFDRGDVFALVTDGLTEVFDRKDNEFGLERLKAAVAAHGRRPLPELLDTVIAEVRRHGPQSDDQSMLLVRCL